ncbi:inactive hydroxysteroid dehydrogenase-like protein 1 [Hyla sarda]|uniref:inactive hydroxysteroid dehydrogenase-like protein 1 n=1 Tax=Hyla sarda TaxID=327740 RepID=UPI0024C3B5B9|nr:inactive hydroxysteroid dehydrogenase-like protein 1 [Hyla sarda]
MTLCELEREEALVMSAFTFNSLKLGNVEGVTLSLTKEVSQFYSRHLDILAVVGAGYTVWKGFHLLRGFYSFIKHQVFPRLFSNTNTILQYGEWAVVTGATDGIGKAYAEELASHGVSIILLGRSTEKLKNVSESISATYGVKTRFIVADLNKGSEVFPSIKEALRDVDVGILVNNAGVCYEYPAFFTEVPEEKSLEIINVNTAAAVMMVYVVLPGMLQRKRGAIINIASITSCAPVPLLNVYAASKAFLDSFTRALQYEYGSHGIFIQSLIPGFVVTKMINFAEILRNKSIFVPLPKDYAHNAVRTIGTTLRTTGHWSHGLQLSILNWMPERIWMFLWAYLNNNSRAEYLSKEKQS